MPRIAKALKPLELRRLTEPGLHAVGHVPGLYLNVSTGTAKSWILRIVVGGKRREIGLGSYPEIELAAALDKARAARQQVGVGIDPVDAKREARSRLIASQTTGWTFDQCATAFIAENEAGWSNAKHAQQWRNTLKTYASPTIGSMLVRHVETEHIKVLLKPIWTQTPETASRVRGRVEAVLGWATTSGYRSGPNPARWTGHLEHALPSPKKVKAVKHHEYLPAKDMPKFMHDLSAMSGTAARALELLILTGVRAANVRKAAWSEFDMEGKVWTIPGVAEEGGSGQRMKAGVELQVPLSSAAITLLKGLPRVAGSDLLFPSVKKAGSDGAQDARTLSDMAMTQLLRRMEVDATPHGFRSSLKTWAADSTSHPREVVEAALGHKLADKVEAAYMRGNWLEKRRILMEDWAQFIGDRKRGTVLHMTRNAA